MMYEFSNMVNLGQSHPPTHLDPDYIISVDTAISASGAKFPPLLLPVTVQNLPPPQMLLFLGMGGLQE